MPATHQKWLFQRQLPEQTARNQVIDWRPRNIPANWHPSNPQIESLIVLKHLYFPYYSISIIHQDNKHEIS